MPYLPFNPSPPYIPFTKEIPTQTSGNQTFLAHPLLSSSECYETKLMDMYIVYIFVTMDVSMLGESHYSYCPICLYEMIRKRL